jgi:hypothetical protein
MTYDERPYAKLVPFILTDFITTNSYRRIIRSSLIETIRGINGWD